MRARVRFLAHGDKTALLRGLTVLYATHEGDLQRDLADIGLASLRALGAVMHLKQFGGAPGTGTDTGTGAGAAPRLTGAEVEQWIKARLPEAEERYAAEHGEEKAYLPAHGVLVLPSATMPQDGQLACIEAAIS